MKRARTLVWAPVLGLFVACGGSTFTTTPGDGGGTPGDDGGGTGGSGSSGAASSSGVGGSTSGGSSGSSGASGSSSGGGSGGSSGAGSSSGGGSGGGSGSGASSSSGSGSGGDGGNGGSPCPIFQPSAGGVCSHAGLVCEYGSGDVQGCDTIATCSSSGWTIQAPTLTDCAVAKNPNGCPLTYGGVAMGTSCTPYQLICNYAEGRCECAAGGPVLHLLPDGGIAATWSCQAPDTASGCPQRRPSLGSACTTPGLSCDYGACYVEGGTNESCTNGVWVNAQSLCPG